MAKRKIKVCCLGDSITKGNFSYNWVNLLSKRLHKKGFEILNRGVNGDLAYNAFHRVTEIVRQNPDVVIILIGTNDVNASLNEENRQSYIKQKNLPTSPDFLFFQENLIRIVDFIKRDVSIVVLVSLPIMGEDLRHQANILVENYNIAIKRIACQLDVYYLPFYEELKTYLSMLNHKHKKAFAYSLHLKLITMFRRFVLLQSWNKISEANNLHLLTDTIHLNEKSGVILSNLIENFLKKHFDFF